MADCLIRRKADKCTALGHEEENGATANIHLKCSECQTVLEDGSKHSYTRGEGDWNGDHSKCTVPFTCDCGYSYASSSENIETRTDPDTIADCITRSRFEHYTFIGGREERCPSWHDGDYGNHPANSYTTLVTRSTCVTPGSDKWSCSRCNGSGSTDLPLDPNNHEGPLVGGGTKDCHERCSATGCGVTTKDGTWHNLVEQNGTFTCYNDSYIYTKKCDCTYETMHTKTATRDVTLEATCGHVGTYRHIITKENGVVLGCETQHTIAKLPHATVISNGTSSSSSPCRTCSDCGETFEHVYQYRPLDSNWSGVGSMATHHIKYCNELGCPYKIAQSHTFVDGVCSKGCGINEPVLTQINPGNKYPNGQVLTWTSVTSAKSYRVYTTGGTLFAQNLTTTSFNMQTMIVNPISGTYDVYVTAVFEDGSELESNHVNVIIE